MNSFHKKIRLRSLFTDYIDVVAAVIIQNDNVLLSQRNDLHLKGLLEFPGGKIRYLESINEAAVREILEELGIKVVPIKKLITIYHIYPTKKVKLHFVLCKLLDKKLYYLINKLKLAKWYPINEIQNLKLCPADKKAVDVIDWNDVMKYLANL